jgi:hypothetical protein
LYKQRLHVKKMFKKFLNSIKLFLLFGTEYRVYSGILFHILQFFVPDNSDKRKKKNVTFMTNSFFLNKSAIFMIRFPLALLN